MGPAHSHAPGHWSSHEPARSGPLPRLVERGAESDIDTRPTTATPRGEAWVRAGSVMLHRFIVFLPAVTYFTELHLQLLYISQQPQQLVEHTCTMQIDLLTRRSIPHNGRISEELSADKAPMPRGR